MKKNIADVDLSSGVPMVVVLDKNMYKSPGQQCSIFIVLQGAMYTVHSALRLQLVVWFGQLN